MSKALIQAVVHLVFQGWRPYNEAPDEAVYHKLGCPPKKTPSWFVRGDIFLCLGCSRRCSLSRPEGFIQPLPIKYDVKKDTPYTLTPREMVQRKSLLLVPEVAYCLNMSERHVYELISMGRLRALKDNPKRVAAEDVEHEMNNFDD